MEAEICGIIVPRQNEIVSDEKYLAECILPRGHVCLQHVFLTPEGKYIAWEDDYTCDCCTGEEDDRCYTYGEITKEEVNKLFLRRE